VVGFVLAATNLAMLSMLLAPVGPQLKEEVGKVVGSLCQLREDREDRKEARKASRDKPGDSSDSDVRRLSTIPGVHVFSNPSFRDRGGGGGGAVLAEVELELEDAEGFGGGTTSVAGARGGAPEVGGVEMTEQRIAPPPRPAEHAVAVEVYEVATGPHGQMHEPEEHEPDVHIEERHARPSVIEGFNPMRVV